MTENDYTLAWGLYALAALGCLLVGFKLTGWMWRWLREPLRVILAVLLLTPTIVDPVKESFARPSPSLPWTSPSRWVTTPGVRCPISPCTA
ncbi:hypothetical protein PspTeo4_25736 [Pseudomonas sp. Teo4]|nr:hypothetical protein [Pseudomonas sp. Teo4]